MSSNSLLLGFDKGQECANNCHISNNCYTCQFHEIQGVPKETHFHTTTFANIPVTRVPMEGRYLSSIDTLAKLECCQKWLSESAFLLGHPVCLCICFMHHSSYKLEMLSCRSLPKGGVVKKQSFCSQADR